MFTAVACHTCAKDVVFIAWYNNQTIISFTRPGGPKRTESTKTGEVVAHCKKSSGCLACGQYPVHLL